MIICLVPSLLIGIERFIACAIPLHRIGVFLRALLPTHDVSSYLTLFTLAADAFAPGWQYGLCDTVPPRRFKHVDI